MDDLVISDLTGVAGLSLVVTLIVAVIKKAMAWDAAFEDRFVPLLSVGVGILIGVPAALYVGGDPVQALLTGLLAGTAAQGVQQTLMKVRPADGGG
jgi:cell division protein FtsW (lipid II flippase)